MVSKYVENKYVIGDIVYAKIDPTLKLVVLSHTGRSYYCKVIEHPDRKELVYFEREIVL